MSEINQRVHLFIKEHQLCSKKDNILVAVSGGMDSVVLVRLLHTLDFKVSIAHMNYGLRGEESNQDESFVRALSTKLGINIYVKKVDLPSNVSLQQWARDERYAWFESLSKQLGFTRIAVGHHADDQTETILGRILTRGGGLSAMVGMPVKRGKIIRPLLGLYKSEINDFVQKQAWAYREDSSNKSLDYDRNIIRQVLLPAIKQYFPQAQKNIQHNATHWQEAAVLQFLSLKKIVAKKVEKKGDNFLFPIRYLEKSGFAKTILWYYAKHLSFTALQMEEVVKLFAAENGRFVASKSHRFIKYQKWILLSSLTDLSKQSFIHIDDVGTYQTPIGELTISKVNILPTDDELTQHSSNIAYIDSSDNIFPLIVRPHHAGDYFYPLGMHKQKKIARFFIDLKLSTVEKEKTWVLCKDKKICWVIGKRIDNRFRLKPNAKFVYKLQIRVC